MGTVDPLPADLAELLPRCWANLSTLAELHAVLMSEQYPHFRQPKPRITDDRLSPS